MNSDEKVRIVIRKKGHGGGHHGGAWKVAYADFVTTMMALFIVLWIVGQSSAVKQAVAGYFRDPGAFKDAQKAALVSGGSGILPAAQPGQEGSRLVSEDEAVKIAKEKEEAALREVADQIKKLTDEGGGFESLKDQVRIDITPEGLRIELLEKESSFFFQVGGTLPTPALKPLLQKLQKSLRTLSNHITVEGHTDGRQYSTRRDYSNWELSTDRAHVARRIMETEGLPAGQIDRIVGHADRILLIPGDPLHASNRRITLLVRRRGQK